MPRKEHYKPNGLLSRDTLLKSVIALPREVVEIEELGGSLTVQAMGLTAWLYLMGQIGEQKTNDFLSDLRHAPHLLSVCVVNDTGDPIMSPSEWEQFGAAHRDVALQLISVAQRLCRLGEDEKKGASVPS